MRNLPLLKRDKSQKMSYVGMWMVSCGLQPFPMQIVHWKEVFDLLYTHSSSLTTLTGELRTGYIISNVEKVMVQTALVRLCATKAVGESTGLLCFLSGAICSLFSKVQHYITDNAPDTC